MILLEMLKMREKVVLEVTNLSSPSKTEFWTCKPCFKRMIIKGNLWEENQEMEGEGKKQGKGDEKQN